MPELSPGDRDGVGKSSPLKTALKMPLVLQSMLEQGLGRAWLIEKRPGYPTNRGFYKADWLVESAVGQVDGKGP